MSVSVDTVLSAEKFRLITMDLTEEELNQISMCRRGILGASGIGAVFGLFGGKIALGPVPSTILVKSVVLGGKIHLNG